MAKIHSEELNISVLQLVRDDSQAIELLTPEIREAIAELVAPMIEELVGKSAIVEIK